MSFLSIDVGSSRCKAASVSGTGELLAMRSASYAPLTPRPGFAELEPDTFLQSVTALAREITNLPLREPIEAVCFSSHGETIVPVAADGKAVGRAILNIDVRATQEALWCERTMGRREIFTLTGHVSHAMYPVPKLLWLRKNAPEVFAAAKQFLGVTDYLLVQFGLPPLIDYSHASRFMAFNVHDCKWSNGVLDMAQMSPDALPIPVQAGTIAGRLGATAAASLGVAAGTPVVVGGHDQVVGAVGLGVLGAGRAAGSMGTYECILVASDKLQLNDAALRANLNCYPHAVPGKFVTIAYYPAGILLQWLNNLFYGGQSGDDAEHFEELELAAPKDRTGLLITPHLIGSCNPEFDSEARAAICGLSLGTTRADLYKGALEGIACEFALVAECMEDAGSTFSHINVSGGGTRSPLGLRLRAGLIQKQLHIMSGQESVCLGGAILASVAIGLYPDIETAVRAMVHEKESIQPDLSLTEQYATQFAKYRRLRSTLVHRHDSRDRETQYTGVQK